MTLEWKRHLAAKRDESTVSGIPRGSRVVMGKIVGEKRGAGDWSQTRPIVAARKLGLGLVKTNSGRCLISLKSWCSADQFLRKG